MPLPIDEVEDIDPTKFLKTPQVYESLEEAQTMAQDVDAAIEAKKKAGDLLGALTVAVGFVKKFLPIPIP